MPNSESLAEVAKVAQQGIGFIDKYFGNALSHVGDVAEMNAYLWKIKNLKKTFKLAEEIVSSDPEFQRKLNRIPDRQAIPLLDAISMESDETIQDLWAAYLANGALSTNTLSRKLTDILKALEPADVPILHNIFGRDLGLIRPIREYVAEHEIVVSSGASTEEIDSFFARLSATGCFTFESNHEVYLITGPSMEGPLLLSFSTTLGEFRPTPLLLLLQRAVTSPTTPV